MAARKTTQVTAETPEPELPFEQARDALTEIVSRLEAGNLTLEESLELWERGEAMAVICRHRLDGALARLRAAQDQRAQAPATHDAEE